MAADQETNLASIVSTFTDTIARIDAALMGKDQARLGEFILSDPDHVSICIVVEGNEARRGSPLTATGWQTIEAADDMAERVTNGAGVHPEPRKRWSALQHWRRELHDLIATTRTRLADLADKINEARGED